MVLVKKESTVLTDEAEQLGYVVANINICMFRMKFQMGGYA